MSCSAFPSLSFLFCPSCYVRPLLPVPFFLSCSGTLYILSCSACPVLPVLFYLSCSDHPILFISFWMSCSVLFCLSCSACSAGPVLDVLFCLSCPGFHILTSSVVVYMYLEVRAQKETGRSKKREGQTRNA